MALEYAEQVRSYCQYAQRKAEGVQLSTSRSTMARHVRTFTYACARPRVLQHAKQRCIRWRGIHGDIARADGVHVVPRHVKGARIDVWRRDRATPSFTNNVALHRISARGMRVQARRRATKTVRRRAVYLATASCGDLCHERIVGGCVRVVRKACVRLIVALLCGTRASASVSCGVTCGARRRDVERARARARGTSQMHRMHGRRERQRKLRHAGAVAAAVCQHATAWRGLRAAERRAVVWHCSVPMSVVR